MGCLHMYVEVHEKLVCLGLLDVKRMGRPRRGGMGSLHMYVETHEKLVCLGLLDVNDGATKARRDG